MRTRTHLAPHSASTLFTASVTVHNTGEREGDEIVLLYISPPGAGTNGRPLRTLAAFERISIGAGEVRTVRFELTAHHLSVTSASGTESVLEGAWVLFTNADPAGRLVNVIRSPDTATASSL